MSRRPPSVLFLCTGNACRSQIAEGWARELFGARLDVASAGTAPAGLDRRAVETMAAAGVDIADQRSKHVDELAGMPFDLVVTVCDRARESCPVLPGAGRTVHRGFDDPAAARGEPAAVAAVFARVRDEIRVFVEEDLPGLVEEATGTRLALRRKRSAK